jgi:tetratricopeptide (TPR) repeat protein
MRRGSGLRALLTGVGTAAAGALIAYFLAGGRWAVVGAVAGAVSGPFAPTIYDAVRERGAAWRKWRRVSERVLRQSPAGLLDPRRQIVDFLGRPEELEALVAWCEDDDASPLRLVTGPGGVGKTRLAVEVSRQLTAVGWRCERVGDGQESRAIEALRAATQSRTLLIVDYAEARPGLSELLSALASESDGIRVLLLARSAGDWWDQLRAAEHAVRDLIGQAQAAVIELSPVVDAAVADSTIVAEAVSAFARVLGVPAPPVQLSSAAERCRVLDLHAAALVAVLDSVGTTESLAAEVTFSAILDELLSHEQRFWYAAAQVAGLCDGPSGLGPAVLRQIVAAACLLGAASEGDARSLLARIPGLDPSVKIARWLQGLYPADSESPEWLGSMQPDRLAELHTIRELAASPELAEACLKGLDPRQARRAVALLGRASTDYPAAADLLSRIIPAVVDVLADLDASEQVLESIVNVIPYPSVVLAPAALSLTRRIISVLPAGIQPAQRVAWLLRLGGWLRESGNPADAVRTNEEAAAIFRELTEQPQNSSYLVDLASILRNLGVLYADLGRHSEAVQLSEEAVQVLRNLADTLPSRSGLAASLDNLAVRYLQLGRPEDAIPVAEEAVEIYRELDGTLTDSYRPELARAMDNLSITYWELGRWADALPLVEQAAAVYRDLGSRFPDRYRPESGRVIANLGARYVELGRQADALPILGEAAAIYRELPDSPPCRYQPELARILDNLAMANSELGRTAAALPLLEEAVGIYRTLAEITPDRYRPELARALGNLGLLYADLGREIEAMQILGEAASMMRELTGALPGRFRPDLARTLVNLAIRFGRLDRYSDAVLLLEEALVIRRELAQTSPDRYRADLASALDNLGVVYSKLGRLTDAQSATEEAVEIYRELAETLPDRYRPHIARALNNLGIRYSDAGDKATALTVTAESTTIRRELADALPDRYRADLASSLGYLSIRYAESGRLTRALPLAEEAIGLYRQLTRAQPDRYRSNLANALDTFADLLEASGQQSRAETARTEAAMQRSS